MTSDGFERPLEWVLYRAARLLEDGDRVFTGTHWPVLVTRVAARWFGPEMVRVFEGGAIVEDLPETILTGISDFHRYAEDTVFAGTPMDAFYGLLRSGFVDKAVIDATNVDRYGNVNSTCIGDYEDPTVRLPGSGGSTEVAAYARNLILVNGSTDPRRYRESVEYITAMGYYRGGDSRADLGFPEGTGPTHLVTPYGLFSFEDNEARLEERSPLFDDSEVQDVFQGWELSGPVRACDDVDPEGLRITRTVIGEAHEEFYVLQDRELKSPYAHGSDRGGD